jgi:hypothetical protein
MSNTKTTLRFWGVLLGLLGLTAGSGAAQAERERLREYVIAESDTSALTLKLVFDDANNPQYFFSNVFTPVCLTGECKPVYINLYWDLLGNYTRFDFPPGKVLTKLDHEEFTPEEYEKLHRILHNPTSLLKDVAMEELVGKGTENLADSVDAKAGATLKTIKNEVIDGAVYTCYTLWHLAHGTVTAEMQRITRTYANDALLHRFLASSNHAYQYWAMDRVIDPNGRVTEAFGPDLLGVMRGKNLFTARYALQKIAPPFFDPDRQRWLWETYRGATYSLQIAILKKLATLPLSAFLTEQLARHLSEANQEQFTLRRNLLAAQPRLSEPTLRYLADQLPTATPEHAAELFKLLAQRKPKNRAVQSRMKAYQNQTR